MKDNTPFHANEKLIVAGQQYLLYAVAQHSGDHPNSGHYVAFIRDSQGVLFCNDSYVQRSTMAKMLMSHGEARTVYVVAHVRDLNVIRVCPRTATSPLPNINVEFFDARRMQRHSLLVASPESGQDAEELIGDMVRMLENEHQSKLQVLYRIAKKPWQLSIPESCRLNDRLECLIQLKGMRVFNLKEEDRSLEVVYAIYRVNKFRTKMMFHTTQTVKDLVHYGSRLMTFLTNRTHNDLSFYIRKDGWKRMLRIGGSDADEHASVYELQALEF
jgi:hypothetical protein